MPVTKKQNITLNLDRDLIMKAKVLAARRSTSVSGLLRDQVEAIVRDDEAYEQAVASVKARLKHGFDLGGGPYASRDSLHER